MAALAPDNEQALVNELEFFKKQQAR